MERRQIDIDVMQAQSLPDEVLAKVLPGLRAELDAQGGGVLSDYRLRQLEARLNLEQ